LPVTDIPFITIRQLAKNVIKNEFIFIDKISLARDLLGNMYRIIDT